MIYIILLVIYLILAGFFVYYIWKTHCEVFEMKKRITIDIGYVYALYMPALYIPITNNIIGAKKLKGIKKQAQKKMKGTEDGD